MIPHALRILERDSASTSMSVRETAVRALGELEGILHPRMPARKGPVGQMGQEDEMEDDVVDEEAEEQDEVNGTGADEMFVEEVTTITTITNDTPMEPPKTDTGPEPPKEEATKPAAQTPTLPSFVSTSDAATTTSTISDDNLALKTTGTSQVKPITSPPTTTKRSDRNVNDIFNTGAWKQIQSKKEGEEEDEEEIPEIDMGFDSDEE